MAFSTLGLQGSVYVVIVNLKHLIRYDIQKPDFPILSDDPDNAY